MVAQLLCKRVDKPGRTAVHEIMFATPSRHDQGQFIELINKGATAVNLTGWRLVDHPGDEGEVVKLEPGSPDSPDPEAQLDGDERCTGQDYPVA